MHDLTIRYTYVIQKWICKEEKETSEVWHFNPWGKVRTVENRESYS